MTEFFRKNKLALAGFTILILLAISAILAPWIAPYDPADQKLAERLNGPSLKHPFGNDELGRDILSRILLGTRVSMRVGATVVLLSVMAGVLIGDLPATSAVRWIHS
jgi:peptide/nickel transport system permease protein